MPKIKFLKFHEKKISLKYVIKHVDQKKEEKKFQIMSKSVHLDK